MRNLEACPNVEVQVGRRSFQAEALRLAEEAGKQQFRSYATRHPLAGRVIFPLLLGSQPASAEDGFATPSRQVPVFLVRPISRAITGKADG
jgi:hypothetical protein